MNSAVVLRRGRLLSFSWKSPSFSHITFFRLIQSDTQNQKSAGAAASRAQQEIQMEKAADNEWMKTKECHLLLEQFFNPPSTHLPFDSFETYLIERGFKDALEHKTALRVLSMVLTNPLTISYALRKLLASSTGGHLSLPSPAISSPKILCVGARSESNLPLVWWREALITSPAITSLSIEMCGPEILHQRHGEQVLLQLTSSSSSSPSAAAAPPSQSFHLHSPPINKCHLHKHQSAHQKLLSNDIFLLFNPGYGANGLMKMQWQDTLKLLLSTKKTIICTAHSEGDLARDLKFLDEITSAEDEEGLQLGEPIEMLLHPQRNPFRSLSLTFDPREDKNCQVVRTNDQIYAFRMK
jgi:hypothetical protein